MRTIARLTLAVILSAGALTATLFVLDHVRGAAGPEHVPAGEPRAQTNPESPTVTAVERISRAVRDGVCQLVPRDTTWNQTTESPDDRMAGQDPPLDVVLLDRKATSDERAHLTPDGEAGRLAARADTAVLRAEVTADTTSRTAPRVSGRVLDDVVNSLIAAQRYLEDDQ